MNDALEVIALALSVIDEIDRHFQGTFHMQPARFLGWLSKSSNTPKTLS